MGSKVMEVIDHKIKCLPPKKKSRADRYRQYEEAKQLLGGQFTKYCEYEYFCKKAAEKYDI